MLDLDETLIHYSESGERSVRSSVIPDDDGGFFAKRPGVDEFLERMAEIYEIVIFTAAIQEYADWVLDNLDKKQVITARLYR